MTASLKKLIAKYRSLPSQLRASFFFVLVGAMKDAVDFLTTPIFTRILTAEEYGLFSVYNSWYQIVRILVSLYIFSDGFSVGMARYGDDRESFVSSQQGLMTVLFAVWCVIYLVGREHWNALLGMSGVFMILMLLQVMFTTPFNCWQSKKRYAYDYRLLTAVMLVYIALQPILGIVLIRTNTHGYNNGELRIWAGVGVQIVFGLVVYIVQFIRRPVFFRKEYWAFALRTNIVLVPHFLSQILLNQSDKLMIDAFIGKASTAIYAVSHAAAFTLHMVTANLNYTFVPWFYEKLKVRSMDGIRRLTGILVILVACAASGLILVAPELMRILGGPEYAGGKWLIPPLTFSVYLIFIYTLFADVELFFSKNVYVLWSSIVGAGANIFLNWMLIPRYGYVAAGYTTVAGYVLMCLCHLTFLHITCRQKELKVADLFDLRLIGAVTAVMVAFCALSMLLYRSVVPRYILLTAGLAAAILKRGQLAGLYRSMKKKEQPVQEERKE